MARYLDGISKEEFKSNLLIQDAVVHNVEVVGEEASRIQRRFPQFCTDKPDLELTNARQMRNHITHVYDDIDLDIVWTAAVQDIPRLRVQVTAILFERREDLSWRPSNGGI
ncbi:MAG: HepT-like ribonuclease domain-containing protein [Ferrimicrobium sp.]